MSKRKAIALHDYTKLSASSLVTFGKAVSLGLTGNASFTTLPSGITLAIYNGQVATLEAGVAKWKLSQSPVDHAALITDQKALRETLRKLANYVTETANGDAAVILSSGFHVSATTTVAAQQVAKPSFIKVTSTQANTLVAEVKSTVSASSWVFAVAEDPSAIQTDSDGFMIDPSTQPKGLLRIIPSHSKKIEVKGLTPLTRYYVVCFGVNAAGKGVDSDTFPVIVI
jgi:hypothetical protein